VSQKGSFYDTDFIIRSAVVGHHFILIAIHIGNVENVEVPDVVCALVFQEVFEFRAQGAERFGIKIFYSGGRHGIVKFKDNQSEANNGNQMISSSEI